MLLEAPSAGAVSACLELVLPPGARLYYYGDTYPASTAVTIEVFYDEIQ